jgi:hypothetical protein
MVHSRRAIVARARPAASMSPRKVSMSTRLASNRCRAWPVHQAVYWQVEGVRVSGQAAVARQEPAQGLALGEREQRIDDQYRQAASWCGCRGRHDHTSRIGPGPGPGAGAPAVVSDRSTLGRRVTGGQPCCFVSRCLTLGSWGCTGQTRTPPTSSPVRPATQGARRDRLPRPRRRPTRHERVARHRPRLEYVSEGG